MMKVIRLTVQDKEKLSRLKGKTGILNWNVLCRWALCCSLKEPSIPLDLPLGEESNVEISWMTFGGENYKIYECTDKGQMHQRWPWNRRSDTCKIFPSASEQGNCLFVQHQPHSFAG